MEEIKNIVNDLIKTYVYQPWHIYTRVIAKSEIDLICIENEKVIRLSAGTWQDNYYNELVERARLDIDIYYYDGREGEHLYISSQCSWDEDFILEKSDEYILIEKVIKTFYEIAKYYEKMEKLKKESSSISPGSPRSELNREFYNKEWEI